MLNMQTVNDLIDKGYIGKNKHPEADLWIYAYTRATQYENHWTPETMACRGLILDGQDRVVSRCLPKFFNLGQYETEKDFMHLPFQLVEKVDGSLGIAYPVNGRMAIASKSSFTSDQAVKATEILHSKYGDWAARALPEMEAVTFIFEIIYPENRIVVNYGDREDLVLLAVVDNATGAEYLNDWGWPGPKPKLYDHRDIPLDQIKSKLGIDGEEGFVVRFAMDGGFYQRLKIKFDDYLRLHNLTNVNSLDVWEVLKDGKPLADFLKDTPDEFDSWVKARVEEFTGKVSALYNEACEVLAQHAHLQGQKEFALAVKDHRLASAVFSLRNGKDPYPGLWKMVRPNPILRFWGGDTDG